MPSKKRRGKPKPRRRPLMHDVVVKPRSVTIPFSNTQELLAKLNHLASNVSRAHVAFADQTSGPVAIANEVLGGERARVIVSGCGHSTEFFKTLSELGLNPLLFRTCVFNAVTRAGFRIRISDVPASPDTKLITVIIAIQTAPRM